MSSVCIGIPVFEDPQRLRQTLECLAANTPQPYELVLLPDGPDRLTAAELQRLTHLPQSGTAQPLGTAACFNRLAALTGADVIVLLESGCLPGKRWLENLLVALHAHPSHGLAGPSTNHCWNQQSIAHQIPGYASSPSRTDVDRAAIAVGHRFGAAVRTLEPLYSLADFCYAVRREVVAAIGAADESYGLGPCWEMDYNIRAARAGFAGIWSCGAYVHRQAFSPRRSNQEARLFEASRRHYQDKFCGRRLRGEGGSYNAHCRGDVCENFAPADLIQIHRDSTSCPAPAPLASLPLRSDLPLVSCIMVTSGRRDFIRQSIELFRRQDYPHRELVIIDDPTSEDPSALTGGDDRIRYTRLPVRLSIGAKRNRGCELARGTYIAHWDDDDWYAPGRLSAQIEPLLSGAAQLSALSADLFFDLPRWQFWRISPELHRRMFVGDVHGGTLVYHRSLYDRGVRYPDRSIAEDAWFLWHAMQRGAQVRKVPGKDLFVYVRHASSTWEFRCGEFLDPRSWSRAEEPVLLASDRPFYRQYAQGNPHPPPPVAEPLVTCIMPTANRPHFVAHAIRLFQGQDYPNRELLILDSGSNPVADLIPHDPRIRYIQSHHLQSLGAQRNFACQLAAGEFIVHWDDDDWHAPSRLTTQIAALGNNPTVDICGLASVYFYNPATAQAWLYAHPSGSRAWLSGNTLCYRKTLWRQRAFPEINEGEDTLFVWALNARQMLALPDPTFFVATVHAGNTSPKRTNTPGWNSVGQVTIATIVGPGFELFHSSIGPLRATLAGNPSLGLLPHPQANEAAPPPQLAPPPRMREALCTGE